MYDQGMTWLLPERFAASEIGPEAGLIEILVTLGLFLLLIKLRIIPFLFLISFHHASLLRKQGTKILAVNLSGVIL